MRSVVLFLFLLVVSVLGAQPLPTPPSTLQKLFQRNAARTVVASRRGYNSLGLGGTLATNPYFSNARTGASLCVGATYAMMEKAQCDATGIRLVFDNHYAGVATGGVMNADGVSPNDLTIHVLVVKRDTTLARVAYTVTFSGGSITQPVLKGGTYSYAVSDPIEGLVLAKGERYWVNVYVTTTNAAIMWPLYSQANSWTSYADSVASGTSGSVGSGDLSQGTTVSGANQCDSQFGMYGPSIILGDAPLDRLNASVALIGDSRIGGDVDSSYPLDDTGYAGYDLDTMSAPYINLNLSGEGLAHLFTNGLPNANFKYRLKLLSLIKPEWAIVAYGVNDATGANGISAQTCAQMQANYTLLCQILHRYGCRIEAHTIAPYLTNVTDTSQYVTQTNMIVGTSPWNNIKSFNNWLNGQKNAQDANISDTYLLSACSINRVVDVEAIAGDAGRGGKFAVESVPRFDYTGSTGITYNSTTSITVAGAAYGVNALKGMVWRELTGAGAGYYKITANTATTITLGTALSTIGTSGTDNGQVWFAWTVDGTHFSQAAKLQLATTIQAQLPNRFAFPSVPISMVQGNRSEASLR